MPQLHCPGCHEWVDQAFMKPVKSKDQWLCESCREKK